MPKTSPDTAPVTGTQTLMRGLSILHAVANGAHDLKTLCARTGIARSTAHRLATLLIQERYLRCLPRRGYMLGPRLIELGFQARESLSLVELAQPYLDELSRRTGDTVHLAVREDDEVLYLEKIPGTKGLEMRSRIGQRMPLAYSGVGKALILDETEDEWQRLFNGGAPASAQARGQKTWVEFLKRMRRYAAEGYAYDLEDNESSIRCVAAPVRDTSKKIVAGISVTSSLPYMSLQRMDQLRPVVVASANSISTELGWR